MVYNFYNLEASFSKFLYAGNNTIKKVSVKNYLSDLRHFLGWLSMKVRSEYEEGRQNSADTLDSLVSNITLKNLGHYKAYLLDNAIPDKTINRRLSAIRKFCTFCISQGWLKENPAKKVRNVGVQSSIRYSVFSMKKLLPQFKKSLGDEGMQKKEIEEIAHDINEFLTVIS